MSLAKIFFMLTLVIMFASCQQKKSDIIDYLNVGKEISFDNNKYKLIWSSHPSDNYYKQEYISEKDSLAKFKKMILLEVITGTSQVRKIADDKIEELKKLKETDPIVNYDMFQKDDEIMIDFILSGKSSDSDIIERNVYRYLPISYSNDKDGVALFGLSERSYGNDIDNFLISLKDKKPDAPNAVGSFVIPEIRIDPSVIK